MSIGLNLGLRLRYPYNVVVGSVPSDATISASRTSGPAPLGVIFQTSTSADIKAGYDQYQYKWDFGESGTWSAIGSDHPHGNAKGTAYGPWAAYTFDTAASRTVTLTIKDADGNTVATDTASITVQDPDTVFATTNTLVVSPTSNYTNKPTGASEYTSFDAAVTAALAAGGSKRVLLHAGESFTNTAHQIIDGDSIDNLYIGSYDTGAKPVLYVADDGDGYGTVLRFDDWGASNYITVTGIEVREDPAFNASTDNYTDLPGTVDGIAIGDMLGHVTFHNITNSGVEGIAFQDSGLATKTATAPGNVIVSDCTVTNWGDYGIFIGQTSNNWAVIGSSLQQNADAPAGNGIIKGDTSYTAWATGQSYVIGNIRRDAAGDVVEGAIYRCIADHTSTTLAADIANWNRIDNQYANHGPIRDAGPDAGSGQWSITGDDRALIRIFSHNEMFSNTTNDGSGGGTAGDRTLYLHQQCLRLGYGITTTTAPVGIRAIVERNLAEGGWSVFSAQNNPSKTVEGPISHEIFEKNYILGTSNTYAAISFSRSGLTIRNNIIVRPNPTTDEVTWDAFVDYVPYDTATAIEADTDGFKIYSNTFVDLRAGANTFTVGDGTGGLSHFTAENNLHHAPNYSSPVTTYDPLDTTTLSYTPIYKGSLFANSGDTQTLDTDAATPAAAASLFKPYNSSSAVDGYSTGLVAPDDFDSALRGSAKYIGAFDTNAGAAYTPVSVDNNATAYVNDIIDANLAGQTIIISGTVNALPVGGTTLDYGYLFGKSAADNRLRIDGTGDVFVRIRSGGSNVINDTLTATVSGGSKIAVMVAVDGSAGKVYWNNVDQSVGFTTPGGNLDTINTDFLSLAGTDTLDFTATYAAVYSGYLDPATYWTTFFASDGSGGFDPVGESGTVNSVTPHWLMLGSVADYNSSTWTTDNSTAATTGTFI